MEIPFGLTFREWLEYRAKLARKIAAVMAGMTGIPKNGYNADNDYFYATEADTNEVIRALMAENMLVIEPELIGFSTRENGKIVDALLRMRMTDAETGYFEDKQWIGSGMAYDEKGIYKAYTGASKHFIIKSFLASQEEASDPERDSSRIKTSVDMPESFKQQIEETKRQIREAASETGHTVRFEDDPPADAIKPEQVGRFKILLLQLADFDKRASKKQAQTSIFVSLSIKPGLKSWAERIKTVKENEEKIIKLTEAEAEHAIFLMEEWLETKQAKKEAAAAAQEVASDAQSSDTDRQVNERS